MDSDLECQHRYHKKQLNSGLTRYQSAPCSYFSSFLDGGDSGEDFMNRPHSPETQRIFSRLLANNSDYSSSHQNVYKMKKDSPPTSPVNQLVQSVKITDDSRSQHNLYQNQLPEQNSKAGMDYRPATANYTGMRTRGANNSNILRHSSSPAGLFSNMNIEFENGYAVLREASFPAANSGISTIAEVSNGETSLDTNDYGIGSWDDNNTFSDIHDSEMQNLETANQPPMLAHHLSLPTSSAEMSAMEKVLQFQDSVPRKVREKRGFATHPRSIAERVRRARISEWMRKLQDLVTNMEKQTHTADMLDLAVDYIKNLKSQVKVLSENREKCVCTKSNKNGGNLSTYHCIHF